VVPLERQTAPAGLDAPNRSPGAALKWAGDAGACALSTVAFLLAGHLVLEGRSAEGAACGLAGLALLALWRGRRSEPARFAVGAGLALAFVAWSSAFIAFASTVGPDGRRYYCLFDDALISMRYGWNLAHGQGLVWNPGERVEGFTSLPMTLLMAVPAWLFDRSGAVLAVQVLGVATLLAASVLAARLARELGSAGRTWALAGVLACYPLAYWTLMGMETGLLSVLLLAAVGRAVEPVTSARPDLRLSALLGLAVLTRPDALLPVLAVVGLRVVESRRDRRRAVALEVAAVALFVIGQGLFRWLYYGSLVPNTYVLKIVGIPLAVRLHAGLVDAVRALGWLLPALALAAVSVRAGDRRHRLVFAAWAASVAADVWMGGDAWPRWRFLTPTLPLLLVLAVDGASRLRAPLRARWAPAAALTLAVAGTSAPFVHEAFLARYPFEAAESHVNVGIAVKLRRLCTSEATVGVFFAGAVPYYSGLRAIDFLGKTDPVIARRPPDLDLPPGHNKSDLHDSIGRRRPDWVEEFYWGRDEDLSARSDYTRVDGLWLRTGSPHVRWELTSRLPADGAWASP
jgi:arabinofuranosyltransferase